MADEELVKRVSVAEFKKFFHLKQVSGNQESLNRYIIAPDINRPGLELSGWKESTDLKRVIIIGNKECEYLASLDFDTQKERFEILTDSLTPCIVMTGGNKAHPSLLEVAWGRNFPVFESDMKSYMAMQNMVAFLSRSLAPDTGMHGVMMNIYGVGVMITGASGIGKSELALELIRRGHSLVSDDRVEIVRIQNDLICSAPELIKGMLEIRGIGIIDVLMMFGASAVLDDCDLELIIRLEPYDETHEYSRLSYSQQTLNILGLNRPVLDIPVMAGRDLSVIIEAAVSNYRLIQKGINSTETFNKRVYDKINTRNRGEKE